jgi:hypothetical protein
MPEPLILPLDPSTPLIEILRAAPPAEACGVWLGGTRAGSPAPIARTGGPAGAGTLLLRSDLGALLRAVATVVVAFEGRVVAVSSTVLALGRMLEIVADGPRLVRMEGESPEQLLADACASGRRVAASRVRYAGVDVPAGRTLG